MQSIVNVVLPVFAIIAVGWAAGRTGLLGEASSEALNRFVYWVALPAMLFRSMATVDLAVVFNWSYIAAFLGAVAVVWALSMVVARTAFGNSPAEAALNGLNATYGNSGYMGIPLVLAAYGQAAMLPVIVVVVINTALMVGIAIVLVELGQSRGADLGGTARHVGRALVRNPMLLGPVAGLVWAALGWPLPVPLDTFTGILGAAAGPCALFSIGLFMVGKPLSEGRLEVGAMTLAKLVVHPLVTAAFVFLVFPTEPLWAVVAVLLAALPTGTGGFVLAQAYGVFVLRTSSVTIVSTVLSLATISLVFILFPPAF